MNLLSIVHVKHPSQRWTILILLHFSKTHEFWSSKANWHLHFSLPPVIWVDLSGNKSLLQQAQKVMVCELWISNRFVCFSVSRFVACHRNYDWRQQKMHLWRRILNSRVKKHSKGNQGFLIFSVEHKIYCPIMYCTLQLYSWRSVIVKKWTWMFRNYQSWGNTHLSRY